MVDKLVQVNFKLTEQQKEDAIYLSQIKGCTLSEYVRNVVYVDLKNNKDKINKYKKQIEELRNE